MVLVDTSIWIRHIRKQFFIHDIVPRGQIAICPPIIQEVLQGTRPQWYEETHETLFQNHVLDGRVPLKRFEEAARLYRLCYERNRQIRSSFDCLIAACAIAHDVDLYCIDEDFEHIAKVSPLKLFTPSPA